MFLQNGKFFYTLKRMCIFFWLNPGQMALHAHEISLKMCHCFSALSCIYRMFRYPNLIILEVQFRSAVAH